MKTTDQDNRMGTTVPPVALPPLSPKAPASYIPIRNVPRSHESPRDVQNNDVSRLPNHR
jgi:hypothetical protein